VGHAQDFEARTGCTVVLPENGAVGGVDVRGFAPGTREIESMRPTRLVPRINAILLTGGSAFGLDATGGVQQFLEEKGVGFDTRAARVPIVPTAVIFDLGVGESRVRPGREMGYEACRNARPDRVEEGSVGAGTGATVGKICGHDKAMRGGVGTASWRSGNVVVGALVVVNALGDVIDPVGGQIVAGARDPESGRFVDAGEYLKKHTVAPFPPASSTTLVVVATNARLNKEDATRLAVMAQVGVARTVRPVHTPYDGDISFALSVGEESADIMTLGLVAGDLVAQSILRAVRIANEVSA
jgi:L-aminopeptidase/D-esterase-like protein